MSEVIVVDRLTRTVPAEVQSTGREPRLSGADDMKDDYS